VRDDRRHAVVRMCIVPSLLLIHPQAHHRCIEVERQRNVSG